MYRSLFFIVFLFVSLNFSFGQKFYFENYSVNEGLAQSKVHDVIQDKNGFIWVGTASGASLFDGLEFTNYSADNGMAENGVRTIYEDKKGIIWFGHIGGGISFYNGKIFQQLQLDSLKINREITSFLEDSRDRLWIATFGSGVISINNFSNFSNTNVKYDQFTGSNNLSDRIFSIIETSDSTIYFIIDNMIKYYDETEHEFKTYRHEGLSFYFQPTVMFEDKDKNLWYGTHMGGLYRQDYKSGNVTVFDQKRDGLAGQWVSCINQDKEGAIWVGTWGDGITRINPNFSTFNHENGLPDNKIYRIIPDREGNILIGTLENGLCIFKGEHIISFQPEHGLLSEQVTTVSEDNQNNIWIGTPKGLCKYNISSKQIKPIILTTHNINHEVVAIRKSKTGKVWIATKNDGIYSYDPITNKIDYNSRYNSMVRYGRVVTSLEVDNEGHVYTGTLDGLFYLEPENNAQTRLLGGNEISALYFDSKNVLWVGTKGKGITTIDDTVINSIESLSRINSLCFTEDTSGNIWIGTEGQGLSVFTTDSMLIKYKTNDGLLADLISALSTDNEGNIWIGTNKGLNKFDITDEKFYSYNEKSGFTGIEVKNQAMFTDFTGNIYCGTVNGLFKFNPRLERANNLEPLTQITNFKVNLKDRPLTKNIKLNYTEKNIYLEYHGICLSNAEKVQYQVMLEGIDIDWLPATSQTYKNYSPLPPGKYVFKVKACNNRGIWNKVPIEFPFTIKPPFYLTWWFIMSLFILIAFAIISYINIREKALKKEKIILEQKVKERTAEVVKKNDELAKKNQDIMDSINYAKRIQQAILPTDYLIKKHFPESFVLFKPKDVVSGDFYWFEPMKDRIMFSAVDCTGHGVPGAFMSIMGHDGLQRAVSGFQLKKPDQILEKLNEIVQDTLQSDNTKSDVKDGMDMAFCVYHPKKMLLEFSGANNPLYIIRAADKEALMRNNEPMEPTMTNYDFTLYETKPNKQPIGPYIHRVPFVMHTFQLLPGDSIYIFSDGYADQFGGPRGRKFMYKNFKNTLLKNQVEDMAKQKSFYNQIINAWMANHEQIDDICLMGVKV